MSFKVKSGRWTDIYSTTDMLQEAAIRSLRTRQRLKQFIVSPITTVSRGRKMRYFNTYFLLTEAGLNREAEILKTVLLRNYNTDITKEPKEGKL